MRVRKGFLQGTAWLGLLIVAGGCAGGALSRVGGDGILPQDLPKDYQQKFEVRDSVPAEPTPQPSMIPVVAAEGRGAAVHKKTAHLKKKGKEPVAKAAPGAFVYPSRRPKKDPIWVGEKLTYEITYFGMPAGDFTVEVMPYKTINNRKVYHVQGIAESSKVFSLFYRLKDQIETFIDYDGMFSHRFHLLLDETKQTRDSLELYDSEKRQTFYWNRWNHHVKGYVETKEFFPMEPFAQDSLSALYFIRSQPLPPVGHSISFPVVSEGKTWEAVVTTIRYETINTPMGKMKTVVVKPDTKYQGILQKKGDSFVWLSDDDRKFMVRVEAKVKIGTVVGALKKIEPGTAP